MKTWTIEIQRVKAMNFSGGLIRMQVDALVQPTALRDEGEPTTVLNLSEANARVLMLLLKTQLAELDGRKAKSRR
jgi:hypothetical protein